jgi:anti-sigma regulatory factor (Ser/Thr protein kinase)
MNRHTQRGPREVDAASDIALLAQPPDGSTMTNNITVDFEAGPDAASGARNALAALDSRVAKELLDDVRLLVSELVTNSVRHSSARTRDVVSLSVAVTATSLRVEVSDPGKGFEPVPRDADRTRPGGWGLYLVDQLADRWGVARDHLTRVWFEMDRKPSGARGVAA